MRHPAVRRGLVALAALVLAGAGIAVLIGALDGGSGSSTTDAPAAPGIAAAPPPGPLGRTLAAGNVVLAFRDDADAATARAWARRAGGEASAALTGSGQAVLAARRDQGPRFVALAWRREQAFTTLADPALTTFVDAWLGRGAPGR